MARPSGGKIRIKFGEVCVAAAQARRLGDENLDKAKFLKETRHLERKDKNQFNIRLFALWLPSCFFNLFLKSFLMRQV